MNTELRRYTGYRLKFLEPRQQPYAWAELQRNLQPLAPLMEAASQEAYFLDDYLRGLTPAQLLTVGLQDGEIFLALHAGKVAGLMMLRDIIHERSATWEAWAHPEYRSDYRHRKVLSHFAHEVIEYAFKPYGKDGLGLIKLKAEICSQNRPALRAAMALGFRVTGMSWLDAFYNSLPHDMVLLERLNPQYFNLANPDPIHVEEEARTAPDADLHPGTSLHAAASASSGGAASDERPAGGDGRKRSRSAPAAASTTDGKPARRRAKTAI